MDCNTIFNRIKNKVEVTQPYEVFLVDDGKCFFGKDRDNYTVFMITSTSNKMPPAYQETRSLRFAFNKKCTFQCNEDKETKIMHVLTCKEKDEDKLLAFIRLTKAFAINGNENDQYYLAKLFSSLSALFDKRKDVSEKELQGLYAELYIILHFNKNGCDISRFWQTKNMMRFDFTIGNKKRMEIKSTTNRSRTHHFNHDQLLSELYDIRIVSVMLRKCDGGISLGELIDKMRDIFADNYALQIHIESQIAYIEREVLDGMKYDHIFLNDNLRFYNAISIPHFNEKTPDGVFNAEYDCNLDTSPTLQEVDIIRWIREGDI